MIGIILPTELFQFIPKASESIVNPRDGNNSIIMEVYKLAKLNDASGDLSKQWFVYYSYRHPETREFVRFKHVISTRLKTKVSRFQRASELIKNVNYRLKSGWNPYAEAEAKFTNLISAMQHCLEFKSASLRKRSIHTYTHLINCFITFLNKKNLHRITVEEFSSKNAREFLDYCKIEKKITNRTYNNYLSHMRTFFNFLIDREYLNFNPFTRIKNLQKEDSEITAFTRDEMATLRDKLPAENQELYVVCLLIFYCFIRPAEIMRLRIENFDLRQAIVNIPGHASKNKRQDVVIIPDMLVEEIKKLHWERSNTNMFAFTRKLKPGIKEAAPTRIAGIWREWADKHDIHKCIYQLKHTGAGMALQSGIDVRDLQLQLRHHSLDMTQIYLEKFNKRPSENYRLNYPRF